MMANHLNSKQKIPDDPKFDHTFKNTVNQHITDNPQIFNPKQEEGQENPILNKAVGLHELENTLKKCKNKSSPGNDCVTYCIFKNCLDNIKSALCDIFTKCITWGYFPTTWKEATIKMIPKANKDKSQVKNHRPISLLSCLGKILERIVTSRLTTFFLNNNLL
eukprot:GHVU01075793.1.p1 GENE.GHVU01075793.1~~GHVU01075793.1.p1  ORF type:complete len:163 (+),score=11.79 GHVU01075793.1:1016-1504(+)